MILSISGLFKTLLLLIGTFVLLRFIGQLMIAKRNINAQNMHLKEQNDLKKQKQFVQNNIGKTNILRKSPDSVKDVDFEEVN